MPPFKRYWGLYAVLLVILTGGLLFADYIDIRSQQPNVKVLAAGVVMGVISLVATVWSQSIAARTQHTLSALQTLRTDREYLIAANMLRGHQRLGEPLSDEALAALTATRKIKPIPEKRSEIPPTFNPTFAEAVDFVLNQNEFLAAGIEEGAMDYRLLEATQRGVVLGLGTTFAPYIRATRDPLTGNPRTWENFVCLFHRMARNSASHARIDLGAVPEKMLWWPHGYPPHLLERTAKD